MSVNKGAETKNCEHAGAAPAGNTAVRWNLKGILVLAACTVMFGAWMRWPYIAMGGKMSAHVNGLSEIQGKVTTDPQLILSTIASMWAMIESADSVLLMSIPNSSSDSAGTPVNDVSLMLMVEMPPWWPKSPPINREYLFGPNNPTATVQLNGLIKMV